MRVLGRSGSGCAQTRPRTGPVSRGSSCAAEPFGSRRRLETPRQRHPANGHRPRSSRNASYAIRDAPRPSKRPIPAWRGHARPACAPTNPCRRDSSKAVAST
ncbi:hypothetical protein EBB05_17965 [Methylobacterium brachiatum]|nr:hypothetical protein EBB05_17965 [Methylobacterium brachiatum]